MIASIDFSQETLAVDVLTALKSFVEHRRKHILRSLRLYGDKALLHTVLQLNKCSKFESIRRHNNDCILYKITAKCHEFWTFNHFVTLQLQTTIRNLKAGSHSPICSTPLFLGEEHVQLRFGLKKSRVF